MNTVNSSSSAGGKSRALYQTYHGRVYISDSHSKNTEYSFAIIDLRNACGPLAIAQIRWLLALRFAGPGTPMYIPENVRRPGCPRLPQGRDTPLGSPTWQSADRVLVLRTGIVFSKQ